MKLEPVDVLRMMRESIATWYPVWEKEDFHIVTDIDGEEESVVWLITGLLLTSCVLLLFGIVILGIFLDFEGSIWLGCFHPACCPTAVYIHVVE